MQDNGKSAIWEPGEVIYEAGNEASEAYLILEGYVNIETKDGLKLNRLGMGEIFGETSILLNVPRTVTAKVCAQKLVAKKIVYIGFIIGIVFTLIFSTNFEDLISIRIAIGSGTAFLVAQLIDVQIFDKLRKKEWFVAPLTSSLIGSTIDTFIFFSISFYGTGIPWITLSLGDLSVKIFVALMMLVPFRLLLKTLKPI